jgi:hypothetical protein
MEAVVTATKNYIERHGRPQSFYVDFGSVFSVNMNNAEREKKTQWERMMRELGIEVIHAHSPQAKGRVERVNQTLQDRLPKEFRLAKVNSIDEANPFLRETDYLTKHNKQFAVAPAQFGDVHKSIAGLNLEAIFCFKDERKVTNDYTITFNKRIFQLNKKQTIRIRPKTVITVKTHLNGCIDLFVSNTQLEYKEIEAKPTKKITVSIIKSSQPRKVHENSKRWAAGKFPLPVESRVKPAVPAVEAEKRN